ncbi:MAG: toll/interleukin-1 receptor domain-containing protein [Tannerella sp.]|jgi:tetratricopeptide (TPR) repeat protein|nr:toll/interleukin-1 receptor domain-containing protein [Tannerella sp.]
MATDILFLANTPLSDSKMNCYRVLRNKFGKKIDVCSLEMLSTKESVKAVFYPVTREDLLSKEFSDVAEIILKRFNKRSGLWFRFYLFPVDFPQSELTSLIDSQSIDALSRIGDVVHIVPNTLQELIKQIEYYLANRNNIRRYYGFRAMEGYFRLIFGLLAKVIYAIAFAMVLLKDFQFAKILPDATFIELFNRYYEWHPLLTYGIVIAPLLFFVTFLLRKRGSRNIGISDEYTRLIESNSDMFSLFILLCGTYSGILQYIFYREELGLGIWNLLFMVLIGCLINLIGRQYYIGKRMFILRHLRADKHTKAGKKLPGKLTGHSSSVMEKMLRLPLFLHISNRPRVFCSYTHSSGWSKEQVNTVLSEFNRYGSECFVDHSSIAVGSSWRHQLRQAMSDADYVICFCDEISCKKPWPAAELEAALLLRSCMIAPHITVVCPRDMSDENVDGMMPVFKYAFLNEGLPTRFVKLIRQSGNVVRNLSKHGYLLQEDYLDRSLAGNTPILFWIPFVLFSFLYGIVGFFTSILPFLALIAFGVFFVTTNSENLLTAFDQLGDILVNSNSFYSCLLMGTIFYILSSILSSFYWRNIVFRLAKKQNGLKRTITSLVQILFCVFSILTFIPVVTDLNLTWIVTVFCICYIAMSAVSEKYIFDHDFGEVIRRNQVIMPSASKNPLPGMAEFRIEQMMHLRKRKGLLKPMYNFFKRYKGTQIIDLYGRGQNDPDLKGAFDKLVELKDDLLKCGHSHNIALLFDDLGEYAGLLGRYQECLNYYEQCTEFLYASLVSGYKNYSTIYSIYYKMAKVYLKLGKCEEAGKYAWYAMHGIYQNRCLMDDHLKKIRRGSNDNSLFLFFRSIRHAFLDRSVTIGFKLLFNGDKVLFEEVKKFRKAIQDT